MTPATLEIRDESGNFNQAIEGIYFYHLPRIDEFIRHKNQRLKIIGIEHIIKDEAPNHTIIYCQITNENPAESSVAY